MATLHGDNIPPQLRALRAVLSFNFSPIDRESPKQYFVSKLLAEIIFMARVSVSTWDKLIPRRRGHRISQLTEEMVITAVTESGLFKDGKSQAFNPIHQVMSLVRDLEAGRNNNSNINNNNNSNHNNNGSAGSILYQYCTGGELTLAGRDNHVRHQFRYSALQSSSSSSTQPSQNHYPKGVSRFGSVVTEVPNSLRAKPQDIYARLHDNRYINIVLSEKEFEQLHSTVNPGIPVQEDLYIFKTDAERISAIEKLELELEKEMAAAEKKKMN